MNESLRISADYPCIRDFKSKYGMPATSSKVSWTINRYEDNSILVTVTLFSYGDETLLSIGYMAPGSDIDGDYPEGFPPLPDWMQKLLDELVEDSAKVKQLQEEKDVMFP